MIRARKSATTRMDMQQQLTIQQALQYAMQLIQASRFDEAQNLLQQIIQQDPNNHDAIHFLAYTANAVGNPTLSEQYLRRAVALQPNNAIYQHNLGALLNNRGLLNEAAELFHRAIALDPRYPDPVMKLGLLYESRDELDRAMEHYQKAIALNPQYAEAHCNLADVLVKTGKYEQALQSYDQALALNPNLAEAHSNRATALDKLGRENEAYDELVRAVQLNPKLTQALAALGLLLSRRREYEQSIVYLRKAIELQPDDAKFLTSLGTVHLRIGQYERAVELFRKAIQVAPNFSDPWVNLGLALTDLGEHDQAMVVYTRALELEPGCASTLANRALVHLRNADFEKGFADYDHRWELPEFKKMVIDYGSPRWAGEPLAGKTLILWHEQGLGDTIHLIRYARILADQGATVIAQVQPALLSLLKGVAGVSQLITRKDPIPPADFNAPMIGVPGILKTRPDQVPADVPYLRPDPELVEQWKLRIQPHPGFRVGIAWCGNPLLRLNHERSIPLAMFAPFSRVPGVSLFSLQIGPGIDQIAAAPMKLIDLTSHIKDFSDTAAFVQNLDLVITVDTAVLHVAGALARPAWALIQKWPDWRWQLDREDTPWYPTMRLFRQPKLRDWESVFNRITQELAEEVQKRA